MRRSIPKWHYEQVFLCGCCLRDVLVIFSATVYVFFLPSISFAIASSSGGGGYPVCVCGSKVAKRNGCLDRYGGQIDFILVLMGCSK